MNRWAITECFDRACLECVAAGGEILCYTAACRYDETSLKMRVNEVTNNQKALTNFSGAEVTTALRSNTAVHRALVDDGTGPAKILQTEWKYGVLMKKDGHYMTLTTDRWSKMCGQTKLMIVLLEIKIMWVTLIGRLFRTMGRTTSYFEHHKFAYAAHTFSTIRNAAYHFKRCWTRKLKHIGSVCRRVK